jgi:hypothetical protein
MLETKTERFYATGASLIFNTCADIIVNDSEPETPRKQTKTNLVS